MNLPDFSFNCHGSQSLGIIKFVRLFFQSGDVSLFSSLYQIAGLVCKKVSETHHGHKVGHLGTTSADHPFS